MIFGVGTDLCDADRIINAMSHEAFVSRVFSANEMAYVNRYKVNKEDHLAAFFAAKEAFVKALGTGFRTLAPLDICVEHNEFGAPYFVFSEKAQKFLTDKGIQRVHLSLSHDGRFALAYVVLEA